MQGAIGKVGKTAAPVGAHHMDVDRVVAHAEAFGVKERSWRQLRIDEIRHHGPEIRGITFAVPRFFHVKVDALPGLRNGRQNVSELWSGVPSALNVPPGGSIWKQLW